MNVSLADATSKAKKIQLVIFDVDGVLTDGGLQFDNNGHELKTFSSLDGHGVRMLLGSGIQAAVITGRESKLVHHRMTDLGVGLVFQGCRNKLSAFEELLRNTQISAAHIAYMGDDLPDLPVMTRVGLAIAVQNAHPFVKRNAHWITTAKGGAGAVRETTDFILAAKNLLDDLQAAYLQ